MASNLSPFVFILSYFGISGHKSLVMNDCLPRGCTQALLNSNDSRRWCGYLADDISNHINTYHTYKCCLTYFILKRDRKECIQTLNGTFNKCSVRKVWRKPTLRYHLTPVREALIRKANKKIDCWRCGKGVFGKGSNCSYLGKQYGSSKKKSRKEKRKEKCHMIHFSYLETHREIKSTCQWNGGIPIFIMVLFTPVNKNLVSINRWWLRHMHSGMLGSHKNSKILSFTTT